MRLKSQFQRRLRILLLFKQFMRQRLANVMSTGKSMHKGVRWFTQDFKKSLFNSEKSSIIVCRKAYHREKTDPSSALIFYRILARFYWQCKKKKKNPFNFQVKYIYWPLLFSTKHVLHTWLPDINCKILFWYVR